MPVVDAAKKDAPDADARKRPKHAQSAPDFIFTPALQPHGAGRASANQQPAAKKCLDLESPSDDYIEGDYIEVSSSEDEQGREDDDGGVESVVTKVLEYRESTGSLAMYNCDLVPRPLR